jgi:hypothetical protein
VIILLAHKEIMIVNDCYTLDLLRNKLIEDIIAPQLKVMYNFMYVIRFPYAMMD